MDKSCSTTEVLASACCCNRFSIVAEKSRATLCAAANVQETFHAFGEKFEQDGVAVITKGLEAGEQVVTNGQSRLTDGVRVAARAAAQPQKPGSGG